MTKPIRYCSIISVMLLFCLCKQPSFAQNFNYGAAAANRAFLNNSFQMQMMNSMMFNNMRWRYKDNVSTNDKLSFEVVTKDSRLKQVKSKIYMDTVLRKTYIVFDDASLRDNDPKRLQRIYPADTKSFKIKYGDDFHMYQPQLANDSCWTFKVISGEINLFTNGIAPIALQKHDGPLQPFTKQTLLSLLQSDAQANKLFEEDEYMKAIEKYNRNFKKAEDKLYNDTHQFVPNY